MASDNGRQALYRQGRVDLAVAAYRRGEFKSIRSAARIYDVAENTLSRRLRGVAQKRGSIAKNRLLSPTEEEALVSWIQSMSRRGMSPRQEAVQHMATLLLRQRGRSESPGKNWIRKLVARHDSLKSMYNRKYDYQRAKCEDPALIRGWFKRLRDTIAEYGIVDDDIYNFDETGFQMGVIATAKVITGTDRAGRPRQTQPGNREWVTIIETIGIYGSATPPLVIFDAVMHQATWYANNLLPRDWAVAVSDNGWTTNQIGLHWLEHIFDKHTKAKAVGRHRLLILDGHGSHVAPEFDRYCLDNNIIVLCMPAHSSHLLQPLDVGCFAVLKKAYGALVEQKIGLGVNHIDKIEFLELYQQARAQTFSTKIVANSFAATGIVPFDPDRVLSKMFELFKTPSPPPQVSPAHAEWEAETPHNIEQLEAQTKLLKQHLQRRRHSGSPPTPSEHALAQLVKGCALAMHSAVLLSSENERLTAENQRQKRKRAQKRSYIARGGILTAEEATIQINQATEAAATAAQAAEAMKATKATETAVKAAAEAVKAVEAKNKPRAPSRCSLCGSFDHKAPKCPSYQSI